MIDLTPLIQAVIAILATLITVYIIPCLKSKLTERDQEELASWVSIAVTAAEQLYSGSGRGEEKKEYILSFLRTKGYSIDSYELSKTVNALIEAAVFELTS